MRSSLLRSLSRSLGFGVVAMLASTSSVAALQIGFSETFALAEQRQAVLDRLVPGTDEAYYYQALVLQQSGKLNDVPALLAQWQSQHGHTGNWLRIAHRQALLEYPQDHAKALDYLKRVLGLNFDHQRTPESNRPDLPVRLDPALISWEAFRDRAYGGNGSVDGVSDAGLDRILSEPFDSPTRRRSALSRVTFPDHPKLADLVIDDLRVENHGDFGVLPVHRLLTRAQLDRCRELDPRLIENQFFVRTYLSRLWTNPDVDPTRDDAAYLAYLERLWSFVEPLPPVHNALKAHVLYHRLQFDHRQGIHDKPRFMTYLQLPRRVGYMRPEYLDQAERIRFGVALNEDFSDATRLATIGDDEPLVREYLDRFLVEAENIDEFSKFVRDDYLRRRQAEVKILAGVGDPEKWAAFLNPSDFQALRDRIDLEFAPENARFYAPDAPVSLALDVKNVETLIVKVFEINALNWYDRHGSEINTDIELDGLVANHERVIRYDAPPLRRMRREFEFPEIDRPGLWVVDFIGNGRSSRVLVRKGRLHHSVRSGPLGQVVTVYDDANRPAVGAIVRVGGRDYPTDASAEATIPYSTSPGNVPMILRQGPLVTLERLDHQSEAYALAAGMHVDREALLRSRTATILIRPLLTLGGQAIPVGLLEEPTLTIVSTDLDGIVTTKQIRPFVLQDDLEATTSIQVPPRLASLSLTLSGKIRNVSRGVDENLAVSHAVSINGLDRGQAVDAPLLSRTPKGWFLEVLGKTGESRGDRPVTVTLKHVDFNTPWSVTLKSDERGRVELGSLEGIESLSVSDSNGTNLGWSLYGDRATGYSVVHVASGETATVPYVGSKSAPDRTELSLVERNGGTFVADRFDALRIEDGLVKAVDLAPGDYELRLKHERRSVLIRVTAGERVGGLALGSARKLELRDADPVRIVEAVAADRKLRIRTAGGNAMTRVHVLATRYRPAFDSFASFDRVRDGENYWMTRPGAPSGYQSGRSIGEEYQYILDRKYARKFPGVMLERPSLLLDPWAVRTTSTGEQTAATGDEFGATDAPAPATAAVADPGALAAAGFDDPINLDFLASGTLLAANRTPQEGVIEIEFPEGFDKHWLTIVAIDGRSTASRSLVVDEPKVVPLDLRLPESLDPTGAFVQRKQVEGLVAGQTLEMAVGSSRFQSYDSVRAVYTLMATLSNDPRFAQFAFLPDWPTFDLEKKRAKYSEFACHELNLFLYYRDREFFDAVIRPYVANKLHKTFVDRWLIGDDLSEFRTPWNYSQLNAFERILLARRIADEAAETRRRLEQQYEIGPITRDEFDRLFQIGVKGFALDAGLANEDFALFYDSIAQNGQAVPDGDAVLLGGIARGFGGGGGRMGGMGGGMPGGGPANEPAPPPGMPGAAGRRMRGAEAARAESLADRESGAAEGESRFARRQVELEALSLERKLAERLFRQVDKTQEWAENRWYQLPLDQQTADRIGTNRFWIDFVKHEGETGFLSPHLAEATDNLSEMLLALAVLDLPFEAPEHKSEIEGDRITLTAAGPMIVFHEQIRPALEAKENEPPILVSQNFFRADDRYRYEGNEQLDKFVVDEFLTHVVYGGQIAVTNPTSSRRRLDLLVEIPQGALPVLGGKATRSIPVDLEPFATRTVETYFYFPAAGDYDHYPVQVSAEERRIAAADPFRFHVVREATVIDRTSWEWVSQYASDDEVLAYLEEHNPLRLDLSRIAFRMSDKGFYERAIAQLSRRHLFEPTLWSYAIRHDDPATIREYLNFRDDFLATVGPWFDGELLSIDPEHRRRYEHLDYRPLVNARTHRLGPQRRILNDRLNEQYHRLMEILSLQPRPNDEDRLAVTYYLLLQDRFEEAIATFESVDRAKVGTPLQYDLFDAWLDLIRENPTRAREIAGKYLEYPVNRWRNAFAAIAAQCDEIAGAGVAVVDDDDRTQQQTAAADRTPSFDFNVADRKIDLSWRNLESVTIRFYRMDVELLFSRNPFVQAEAGRFSHIRPNETLEVTLPAGETNRTIELPESLRTANVLVEVTGGSESRAQAYYAHALDVQLQDEFGQLQVRLATDRKPLSRTYVKVYARMNDGSIRFYKDGYTDLRGRFDYASLSTDALDSVERFSILVLHDEHGALVRETAPPKR